MVAINGRQLLRRAVSILRRNCNLYFSNFCRLRGRPAILGRSSSFVHRNPNTPSPTVIPTPPKRPRTQVTPSGQITNSRKHGRVKRKRYTDLAKGSSILFVPGGFRQDPVKKQVTREYIRRKRLAEAAAADAQAGGSLHDQYGRFASRRAAKEHVAFVKSQLDSLMFDKAKRESEFEIKEVSERVKGQAAERKARLRRETAQAERLWKAKELEKERWRERRLAQLEREIVVVGDELAREKIEREHSRAGKVLNEKELGRLRGREANLLRQKAELEGNLQATNNAFRRVRNERDHIIQEKEEEKAKRIRVEESLRRWKEQMKQYFPGGQEQRNLGQQQGGTNQQPGEQPQPKLPSLQEQFELYEKKWEVLRSGVDINGTAVHLIHFSQIPWPVVNMTLTDPSQIQPGPVREFVMHPLRNKPGKNRSKKFKVMDELGRWHPDKFNPTVLSRVRKEDRDAVSKAAIEVTSVLTNMLR